MQTVKSKIYSCNSKEAAQYFINFIIRLLLAVFQQNLFFFQRHGNLLKLQIIFGNMVNTTLENLTNLWKYDMWYNLIPD